MLSKKRAQSEDFRFALRTDALDLPYTLQVVSGL